MERRHTKRAVNEVTHVEEESLDLLTPTTDVTKMPYQGYLSNQEYYSLMQSSCFELDKAIKEIVDRRFTGNNLRSMSDEDAIEAYKALEQAKSNRIKMFIDLVKNMSDNEFFRKQQELERLRIMQTSNGGSAESVIEAEVVEKNEADRERQQQVLRLLQEAVTEKLRRDSTDE